MISTRKLMKLAMKWRKLAAIKRKRIISPQAKISTSNATSYSTSVMAEKGHFVVYSADQTRFELPLEYLDNQIIRELFNMAEEEFGLQSRGAPTLPCDNELMEYAIALIKKKVTRDVENAFLMSISTCVSSCLQDHMTSHQLPICCF